MEQRLCASDYKFMCIVWENEPLKSGELVIICDNVLGWKKSTTYTMVKKLSEKGYLKNEDSVVSALIPKTSVQESESEYVVNNTFDGSLPAFIAAFMKTKNLTTEEITDIQKIIEAYRGEK